MEIRIRNVVKDWVSLLHSLTNHACVTTSQKHSVERIEMQQLGTLLLREAVLLSQVISQFIQETKEGLEMKVKTHCHPSSQQGGGHCGGSCQTTPKCCIALYWPQRLLIWANRLWCGGGSALSEQGGRSRSSWSGGAGAGMGAHRGLWCWGCGGGRASSQQDLAHTTAVTFRHLEPLSSKRTAEVDGGVRVVGRKELHQPQERVEPRFKATSTTSWEVIVMYTVLYLTFMLFNFLSREKCCKHFQGK